MPNASSDDVFAFAPGWKPEIGDTVIGEVSSLDRGASEWGPYPIVTLRIESGQSEGQPLTKGDEIAVHAFHAVLKNALRSARPNLGDKIGVKYIGLKDRVDGKGDPFHAYQVRQVDTSSDDFWGKPDTDMFDTPAPF